MYVLVTKDITRWSFFFTLSIKLFIFVSSNHGAYTGKVICRNVSSGAFSTLAILHIRQHEWYNKCILNLVSCFLNSSKSNVFGAWHIGFCWPFNCCPNCVICHVLRIWSWLWQITSYSFMLELERYIVCMTLTWVSVQKSP